MLHTAWKVIFKNPFKLIYQTSAALVWTILLWYEACTWSLCGCRSPKQKHGRPRHVHLLAFPAWTCSRTLEAWAEDLKKWRTGPIPRTSAWGSNPEEPSRHFSGMSAIYVLHSPFYRAFVKRYIIYDMQQTFVFNVCISLMQWDFECTRRNKTCLSYLFALHANKMLFVAI